MPQNRRDEALVGKSAALIIDRLEEKLIELSRSIQELLFSQVPEVAGDGELMQLLYDAVQGNLDTFFPTVRHGIAIDNVEPPTAALEHARRLAQRGIGADALIRSYRLGHQAVVRIVLDELRDADVGGDLVLDVFERITSMSFQYVDRISRQALAAYQRERDRWLANDNRVRALRVRELLVDDDTEIDIDEMTHALRYPLRRTHVALIVWCAESKDGNELVAMERFIGELAKSIGLAERPLFLAADRVTGWAWLSLADDSDNGALNKIRTFVEERPDAPWIAVGDSCAGIEGFRHSHRRALTAQHVVTASGSQPPPVAAANDPGLIVASQFSVNLDETRGWVREVLGPLSSATDSDERMRETLKAFLRSGSSFKATAEELHLHVNSVKYRVQRAIDRRGRPITDDRLDVEVALLLCHWFDTAVLS
jgi:DNA-binding PucR family transcriptional regulator